MCRVFCVYSARAVYSAWMELMCQVWVACGTPLSGDGFVLQLFNMKQLSSSSFSSSSCPCPSFPPCPCPCFNPCPFIPPHRPHLIVVLVLILAAVKCRAEGCMCLLRWIDCSTQIKMKSSDGYGSFILSHYLILSNPSTTTDG